MKKYLVVIIFLGLQVFASPFVIDGRALTTEEEKTFATILRISSYAPDAQSFTCGATLIAPKVLLTAAHCVNDSAPFVILSRSDKISEYKDLPRDKIKEVKIFPYYDKTDLNNTVKNYEASDLALIILKDDLAVNYPAAKNFSYFELMLADDLKDHYLDQVEEGSDPNFFFFGFGTRSYTEHLTFYDLRMAELPAPFKMPKYIFPANGSVTSSIAFKTNKLAEGDSGAPLFYKKDNINYLIGINSTTTIIKDQAKDIPDAKSTHATFTKDAICWMVASSPYRSKHCTVDDPITKKFAAANLEHKQANEEITKKFENEFLNKEVTISDSGKNFTIKIIPIDSNEGPLYKVTLTGDINDRCYFDIFSGIENHTDLDNQKIVYSHLARCGRGLVNDYIFTLSSDGLKIKAF